MELSNVKNRSGYLGGTDAALVARIGGGGQVGLSHFIRLAVAYGDLPGRYLRETPQTEAMQWGHDFEDYFFEEVASDWLPRIERQYVLRRPLEGLPLLIAHADGYDEDKGLVLELKFSRYATTAVLERYKWQLQWYYFLGAEKVRLIHGSGTLPDDVRIALKHVDKDPAAQEQLLAGLLRIKELRQRIRDVAERIEIKEMEEDK
ncbi:MAG: hypothetical protein LUJ25_05020 [Firmicutes bacterium]|nr:hypothetical protein [Bacillota bacterium]